MTIIPIMVVSFNSCSKSTELHRAVARSDIDSIRLILANDKKLINKKNEHGETSLHIASLVGNKNVVIVLVDCGARIDAVTEYYGDSPLWIASREGHFEVVEYLLDKGADINMKSTKGGWTPLHIASTQKNNTIVIEKLLNKGADTSIRDNKGRTPIELADYQGRYENVKLLKSHSLKQGSNK